jgi:hypothetical protein
MNQHVSQQVSALMQKEVSRKEFLTLSGLAVASVMGVGSIVKLVTGKSLTTGHNSAHGYGSSAYGR